MSRNRYIRDPRTGVVLLGDKQALSEYRAKKAIEEQLELLSEAINTLKTEVNNLRTRITDIEAKQ